MRTSRDWLTARLRHAKPVGINRSTKRLAASAKQDITADISMQLSETRMREGVGTVRNRQQ
jgi:hypothetical protein